MPAKMSVVSLFSVSSGTSVAKYLLLMSVIVNFCIAHATFYGPTQRLGTVRRVNKCGEAIAEDG